MRLHVFFFTQQSKKRHSEYTNSIQGPDSWYIIYSYARMKYKNIKLAVFGFIRLYTRGTWRFEIACGRFSKSYIYY